MCVPEGAGGRGQGAHEMGDVVWYADGERRDLWLNGFHWRFRFVLLTLDAGQRGERDLYVGAGKSKRAPVRKTQRHVNTYRYNRTCTDMNTDMNARVRSEGEQKQRASKHEGGVSVRGVTLPLAEDLRSANNLSFKVVRV